MRIALLGVSAAVALSLAAGCGGSSTDASSNEGDAVTSVPGTGGRDQNTTGGDSTNDCWLYTTTAWVESMELAQARASGVASPTVGHLSVSYFDYWDWYSQITTGKTNTGDPLDPTSLDDGGEWGDVADMMLARGVVLATDFIRGTETASTEANVVAKAATTMAASLKSGALKTAAARANGATVRKELDRAFGLSSTVSTWLTANFGADGATTFAAGGTPEAPVVSTDAINVIAPHPDGTTETVTLTDALGVGTGGLGSDGTVDTNLRSGPYAWSDAEFTAGTAAQNRAYFTRIQSALNMGVAVPFGWFWADNADPNGVGQFKGAPTGTTNSDDSNGHYTLAVDYQVSNVPGYGTLKVGVVASDAAKAAALDPRASVDFFRTKDSEPYDHNVAGTGYSDEYMTYLLASDRVYDRSSKTWSTEASMMQNVILPPGF